MLVASMTVGATGRQDAYVVNATYIDMCGTTFKI